MQAMVLAAGFGMRMRPLSERCPKPLLPILGQPLIAYTIHHLRTLPITRIGINAHHCADRVQSYVEKDSPWGVEVVISREPEILGTGGGMRELGNLLSPADPFLVYNGDVLSDIDLCPVLEFHAHQGPLVTLVLYDFPPKNNVTLSPEGTVIDFLEKLIIHRSQTDRALTFTGISVVDPQVLSLIPATGASSIVDVYLDLITRRSGCIHGYVAEKPYWIDIGTPASYLKVHQDILIHGKRFSFSPSLSESRFYRGPGSAIAPGARLEGFVSVGSNCVVERGAFLRNCVIWDDTVVKRGQQLEWGVQEGEWKFSLSRRTASDQLLCSQGG